MYPTLPHSRDYRLDWISTYCSVHFSRAGADRTERLRREEIQIKSNNFVICIPMPFVFIEEKQKTFRWFGVKMGWCIGKVMAEDYKVYTAQCSWCSTTGPGCTES